MEGRRQKGERSGEERKRRRRGYRRLQTLHGSPPSHNNTTPSPLAATQLLSSPRGVEVLPATHAFTTARFHARFHRPYLPHPTIFSPAYENPIQGETHLFLPFPPRHPSRFSDSLLTAPHIFSPPSFLLLFLFLLSRPRYFSLSLSLFRCFFLLVAVDVVAVVIVAGRTKPPPLDLHTTEINEKHTSK